MTLNLRFEFYCVTRYDINRGDKDEKVKINL